MTTDLSQQITEKVESKEAAYMHGYLIFMPKFPLTKANEDFTLRCLEEGINVGLIEGDQLFMPIHPNQSDYNYARNCAEKGIRLGFMHGNPNPPCPPGGCK